ncbi:hypothetical protein BJP34_35720 (plasmid) [Moorena producens PAL-8-15-08-1]|uniref:Uncharacterized protein n=1 Tax=Moorena producens PAL-8-15-08-1 TaxID=1458985 RepID=A0A1D8U4A5_9CYAN|nr:hypothetical protein [Moorena producens]AOX04730.1 hypothetical protein BJP34_35720 [Moorena producens PAL-8-15-08-1]
MNTQSKGFKINNPLGKNGYGTGTQVKSRGKNMTFKLLLSIQKKILQHLKDEGITVQQFCDRMVLLYQMFVMGEEITPEKLKKAGMSSKQWERLVKYILSRLKFS